MSNTVISIENVSKQYRLGVIGTGTFRNDLKLWWAKTRNKPNPLAIVDEVDYGNRDKDILWALKNVTFTVPQGQALGIIGRNGAGKSTLLKILSRVTTPSNGEVKVKGRIASLLEVGTGFHPELTGRENIFLNGAIMGMSRSEVARKFDEIVDFSGVEKFIDTPVKRYSSGMYVRLAFAVAAHLEPEILIVDEVLAVGDAEFQKKCLGKMGDVAHEGRTVLFVSHNMGAILSLCQRALLFSKGSLVEDGTSTQVINHYIANQSLKAEIIRPENINRKKFYINSIRLLKNGIIANSYDNSEILNVQIVATLNQKIKGIQVAFELLNESETVVFCTSQLDFEGTKPVFELGNYIFTCPINLTQYREGQYSIRVSSAIPNIEMLDQVEDYLIFTIHDVVSPTKKLGAGRRGIILPIYKWEVAGPC